MTLFPQISMAAPLRNQAQKVLEELIIQRHLEPGSRLVESKLAEELGVSRNPVREAIIALERDGWVESLPRQGTVVRVPSPKEARDTFVVRSILETEAAAEAARRIEAPQIEGLWDIVREGWAALDRDDAQEIVDCNARFHRTVLAASDNLVLAQMLEVLDKRVRWLFKPVAVQRGRASWEEHEELLHHLEQGDSEGAAAVMRKHTSNTTQAYALRQATEDGDGGSSEADAGAPGGEMS
jgi:DNA-binding GntR family transcriptional regulator